MLRSPDSPYLPLVACTDYEVLSALSMTPRRWQCRVRVEAGGRDYEFSWKLSRQADNKILFDLGLWADALAAFARSGGFSGCGAPLPQQPLHVIWGANDRILRAPQKQAAAAILRDGVEEFDDCGHLPHIDQPRKVADRCLNWFQT